MAVSGFDEHTRAFIKIEDGCNRFCSYCIIPYARGRVRSKPLPELKTELEAISARGYKEIVLVGINLLREGLDIPEVSLIAILDADKEGFLRSETALIQTIGRAARNVDGRVILYADVVTDSMRRAIDETERRRSIQTAYNEAHGIVPKSIQKKVHDVIRLTTQVEDDKPQDLIDPESMTIESLEKRIDELQKAMYKAAADLEFETAAVLRDTIMELKTTLNQIKDGDL